MVELTTAQRRGLTRQELTGIKRFRQSQEVQDRSSEVQEVAPRIDEGQLQKIEQEISNLESQKDILNKSYNQQLNAPGANQAYISRAYNEELQSIRAKIEGLQSSKTYANQGYTSESLSSYAQSVTASQLSSLEAPSIQRQRKVSFQQPTTTEEAMGMSLLPELRNLPTSFVKAKQSLPQYQSIDPLFTPKFQTLAPPKTPVPTVREQILGQSLIPSERNKLPMSYAPTKQTLIRDKTLFYLDTGKMSKGARLSFEAMYPEKPFEKEISQQIPIRISDVGTLPLAISRGVATGVEKSVEYGVVKPLQKTEFYKQDYKLNIPVGSVIGFGGQGNLLAPKITISTSDVIDKLGKSAGLVTEAFTFGKFGKIAGGIALGVSGIKRASQPDASMVQKGVAVAEIYGGTLLASSGVSNFLFKPIKIVKSPTPTTQVKFIAFETPVISEEGRTLVPGRFRAEAYTPARKGIVYSRLTQKEIIISPKRYDAIGGEYIGVTDDALIGFATQVKRGVSVKTARGYSFVSKSVPITDVTQLSRKGTKTLGYLTGSPKILVKAEGTQLSFVKTRTAKMVKVTETPQGNVFTFEDLGRRPIKSKKPIVDTTSAVETEPIFEVGSGGKITYIQSGARRIKSKGLALQLPPKSLEGRGVKFVSPAKIKKTPFSVTYPKQVQQQAQVQASVSDIVSARIRKGISASTAKKLKSILSQKVTGGAISSLSAGILSQQRRTDIQTLDQIPKIKEKESEKLKSFETLSLIPIGIQKEDLGLKTGIAPKLDNLSRIIPLEQQRSIQEIGSALRQQQQQKQRQQQQQIVPIPSITPAISPLPPITPTPFRPLTPSVSSIANLRAILPKAKAYDVYVKRGGQFKKIANDLPFNRAMKKADETLTNSLGAWAKVVADVKAKKPKMKDIDYRINEQDYRTYQVKGGNRIELPLGEFIEHKNRRITSPTEIKEILSFQSKARKARGGKRSKNGFK